MINIAIHNYQYLGSNRIPDGTLLEMVINGHSFQAPKGKDIVCAAVSVLSQTLVLSLEQVAEVVQTITQEAGSLRTVIELNDLSEKQCERVKILFDAFLIGINELRKDQNHCIEVTQE